VLLLLATRPLFEQTLNIMSNLPFSPWPCFTSEEAEAVNRVLLSNKVNYWTGNECQEFEKEFSAWAGCNYAVALANGSIALELALRALDIGPGDEVIVTPRTFLASVSCIVAVGATPVFADVDKNSQNITAETIRAVLTAQTRAVICVHLAGLPCDMDPIITLANEHGLKVVEDCAQAHGATYKGRTVGSIGHVGAWSFCQDKIITTGGEGGMVTTNDRDLWLQMWSYKDHGKSWAAVYENEHPSKFGFRWLNESFGTNGRMMEVQAVIGRIQLRRMGDWTARRTNNAERISEVLRGNRTVRVPEIPDEITHAWYRVNVFVRPECLAEGWDRDRIMEEVIAQGVPCYSGTCPEVYLEKAFDNTNFRPTRRLPVARQLGETSLAFLVHPTLTDVEIDTTCKVADKVFVRASK
jgi:dTDP-4-amino-4,6-dideoxygalactose transaminase